MSHAGHRQSGKDNTCKCLHTKSIMFVMSAWRGCGDKKRPRGSALKPMTLAAQAICGTKIIKELQRHRFGRRAETLPEEQMLLGLEDVEQVAASGEAEQGRKHSGWPRGAGAQAP